MNLLPVQQGERIRNAFNGETFIFTYVSEDADVVQFDVYLEPGGMLTGTGRQHVHPGADEEFTVVSGAPPVQQNARVRPRWRLSEVLPQANGSGPARSSAQPATVLHCR